MTFGQWREHCVPVRSCVSHREVAGSVIRMCTRMVSASVGVGSAAECMCRCDSRMNIDLVYKGESSGKDGVTFRVASCVDILMHYCHDYLGLGISHGGRGVDGSLYMFRCKAS